MNYGKDATEKRLQAANSRSNKYRSRIFLTFIKTCCVLCLFCVLVISSIGIGIIMGIIDNAPELNVDMLLLLTAASPATAVSSRRSAPTIPTRSPL